MKGYEGRGRRRRTQEPTLGDNWKAMKGDKTNEGRQGGNGSQEQPRMGIMQGDKWRDTMRQRREMKGDKAATAAKSSPEWGSCRETNEGTQCGSGDKWRETRRQRQPRAGKNGDHAGRQMKGDKAADQQPNFWEIRTPIASGYFEKNEKNGSESKVRKLWLKKHGSKIIRKY